MGKTKDKDMPVRRPNVVGPDGKVPPGWEDNTRRWRRTVILTCMTPTCENFGRVWEDKIDDNADGIDRVMCGLCTEWMDNIQDHPTKRGFTRKGYKAHFGKEWDSQPTDWDED